MNRVETVFWATYARVYDLVWDTELTRCTHETILADCRSPGRAVDLGCGTGLGGRFLAAHGWDVLGVDASPAMLRIATRRGGYALTVEADAADTGLTGGQADLVLVNHVLHLHPQPQAVLQEALRLTTLGGRIVCVWPADGAGLENAFRADLDCGRPILQSITVAAVRFVIGIPGLIVGARRWSGRQVTELVRGWAQTSGSEMARSGTLFGVEEFAIFVAKPTWVAPQQVS